MNFFTKCLCNKVAKLQFINLDYIDKYLEILRDAKHAKEESTMNKVIYLNFQELMYLVVFVFTIHPVLNQIKFYLYNNIFTKLINYIFYSLSLPHLIYSPYFGF